MPIKVSSTQERPRSQLRTPETVGTRGAVRITPTTIIKTKGRPLRTSSPNSTQSAPQRSVPLRSQGTAFGTMNMLNTRS